MTVSSAPETPGMGTAARQQADEMSNSESSVETPHPPSPETPPSWPHASRARYRRFDRGQRLEHAVLILSFTVLTISGLPQKYPDSWWGQGMISLMGGIEMTRVIHHIAAVVLVVASVFHLLSVGYRLWVQRAPMSMMPGWRDVKDATGTLSYNLGKRATPPQMGRYTFGEKIEYWAVIWGTAIMILTGFVLWNPILTTDLLPGQFVPAAKAAHGGEALLAVLSIVTWHFFHVLVKHANRSIFTGDISGEIMEEEHPLELADIESGVEKPAPSPRRRAIYLPVATVVGLLMLAGVYFFVTYETTAITTVPRQPVDVYVPAPEPESP